MVPLDRGEDARDRLRALGHPVTWRTWPMGHEVCLEEIREIGAFLLRGFAPAE
jgi:phospholipase/carboxylesterase